MDASQSNDPLPLFIHSQCHSTDPFVYRPPIGLEISSRYTFSTCFFPSNAHWRLHKYSAGEQDEQGVRSLLVASIFLRYNLPTSHVSWQSLLIKKL